MTIFFCPCGVPDGQTGKVCGPIPSTNNTPIFERNVQHLQKVLCAKAEGMER